MFILGPGKKIEKKNSKKIQKIKNLFPALFVDKTGWDRPRKRKKNFRPEFYSYPTQAKKFQKKNSKKIQKFKVNSSITSIENGLRVAKEERKKFFSRIPFILDQGKKIPKKIAKKLKKLKNTFPTLFIAKTVWDRSRKREKNLFPNSVQTRPGQENSEKKEQKNLKN